MHKRWNHKQTLSWQRSEERQRIKERRADEVKIQIAKVETAKEQAKTAAEKELALKELQSRASTSATADPPPRNRNAKSPKLPSFINEDDLDSYLLHFKCYAEKGSCEKNTWGKLRAQLTGRAMEVYTRMSDDDANNYKLKKAFLTRYNYAEDGYRNRFREAKPET